MAEYIDRKAAIDAIDGTDWYHQNKSKDMVHGANSAEHQAWYKEQDVYAAINAIPAADVVEEENILKFYYVRSIDEYWIGQRIDNFYYAEYDPKCRHWVWTHSRYLPWGEHVVSPTSLWKEHTYPSEPEEIPFEEWLQGFIKKYAADVRPVVLCKDCKWTKADGMEDPAIYCKKWDRWEMPSDGFCWLGKKRKETTNGN